MGVDLGHENRSRRDYHTFLKLIFGGISTYDHRSVRTGHPVRSAIHKH
jgi:hypothetical protein